MIDPTYAAATSRLNAFIPHAGYDYASRRNYDRLGHAHVSQLSPYLRHRIVTEEDVLRAVLAQHTSQAASKFIAEIYWRTYWKGWLEMRPSIWTSYKSDLIAAHHQIQTQSGLRANWEAACKGETGIDCFDHWAKELANSGYLHNHARMWFASIWIFTLRLPWTLGADFFLRHLLDGDPASNTLSWRWVGGLQTVGKTYLATADNIAKFTEGRFHPKGLADCAAPLAGPPNPAPAPIPTSDAIDPNANTGLLITDEDMSPNWCLAHIKPSHTAALALIARRSPLTVSAPTVSFTTSAMDDMTHRFAAQIGPINRIDDIQKWAAKHGLTQIVTSFAPVGPTADFLAIMKPHLAKAGVQLVQLIRPYDTAAWPHATKGFFKFKDKIPDLLPDAA